MENNTDRDVLVLGGGIVGLSCALQLALGGYRPCVITASPMRGTPSWGNAGHIAVEQVEPLASIDTVRSLPARLFSRGGAVALPTTAIGTWLPFSLRLLASASPARFSKGREALTALLGQAFPAWQRLADTLGQPDLIRKAGHVIVWESDHGAAKGRAHWHSARTGTAEVHDIAARELSEIEDLVGKKLSGGVRVIGSGQIVDPGLLADALAEAVTAHGGRFIFESAQHLDRGTGGRAEIFLASGESLSASTILLAAGAHSAGLLRPLGIQVPLIAERGYHIEADTAHDQWPEDMAPVVFEERSLIVTRFAHSLRAASFVEFSHTDAPADPRKWERLHGHAAALKLPIGPDARPWMGARPTLPDYLPAIGRSARFTNLAYAFGHQHLGLTLGPLTGELVAALINGADQPASLAPFDLSRWCKI